MLGLHLVLVTLNGGLQSVSSKTIELVTLYGGLQLVLSKTNRIGDTVWRFTISIEQDK